MIGLTGVAAAEVSIDRASFASPPKLGVARSNRARVTTFSAEGRVLDPARPRVTLMGPGRPRSEAAW